MLSAVAARPGTPSGGAAHQPRRGCRHPRQDHHRPRRQQVRHRPGASRRALRPRRRPARHASRSAWRCISAARSAPWRPTAPPTPRRRRWSGRCAPPGTPCPRGLRRRPGHRLPRRAGGSPDAFAGAIAPRFGGLDVAADDRARPLAGRPGRPAARLRGADEDHRPPPLRRAGRRHERPAAPGHVRRLARHRPRRRADAVAPPRRATSSARSARPGTPSRDAARLPPLAPHAKVAILDAGAYGSVMSSTYNARPLAAQVMVDGDRWAVIRARQPIEALWAGETVPAWMDAP